MKLGLWLMVLAQLTQMPIRKTAKMRYMKKIFSKKNLSSIPVSHSLLLTEGIYEQTQRRKLVILCKLHRVRVCANVKLVHFEAIVIFAFFWIFSLCAFAYESIWNKKKSEPHTHTHPFGPMYQSPEVTGAILYSVWCSYVRLRGLNTLWNEKRKK